MSLYRKMGCAEVALMALVIPVFLGAMIGMSFIDLPVALDILYMIVPVALVVAMAVPLIFLSSSRTRLLIREMADRSGLTVVESGRFGAARGVFHGSQVTVDYFLKGRINRLRCVVHFPSPLGMGLEVWSRYMFIPADVTPGWQEIKTGDAAFDGEFIIHCATPQAAPAFLTPRRRQLLLEVHANLKSAGRVPLVSDAGVGFSKRFAILDDPTTVEEQLEWLAKGMPSLWQG